jgi:hypothetical protein
MLTVHGLECLKCGDRIYSRARHDFRSCECGDIFVDGGFDYMRGGYKDKPPIDVEIDVDATIKELYDDWNLGRNLFGRVPEDRP